MGLRQNDDAGGLRQNDGFVRGCGGLPRSDADGGGMPRRGGAGGGDGGGDSGEQPEQS